MVISNPMLSALSGGSSNSAGTGSERQGSGDALSGDVDASALLKALRRSADDATLAGSQPSDDPPATSATARPARLPRHWSRVRQVVREEGAQGLRSRRGDSLGEACKRFALMTLLLASFVAVGGMVYSSMERRGELLLRADEAEMQELVQEMEEQQVIAGGVQALVSEMLTAASVDIQARNDALRKEAEETFLVEDDDTASASASSSDVDDDLYYVIEDDLYWDDAYSACAPGCPANFVGDRFCDEACYVEACDFVSPLAAADQLLC